MSEDNELGFIFRKQIIILAALFYQSDGRVFDPTIDFENSNHPEESRCWNKAIIAYSFIQKDNSLLEHQV
jgi:hypothetical protein